MANEFIGRRVDVGIAREATRGTYVTPEFWLPKTVITVEDKVLKVNERSGYGNIGYEGNQSIPAQKWAEGDLEFPMFDRSFGAILYATLGALSTAGPSDSAYTHTFSLQNDNSHDSLSLSVVEADIAEMVYRLAMIEELEITFAPDQEVMCKVTFMSKRSQDYNLGTPTYTAENKFVGRHLNFKLASLTSGLGAASNIPLRKLTLRFTKRLKMGNYTGTVDVMDIFNQAFSIEGDVEMDLTDKTYRALMMDGTYKACRIQLINDQVTIGASSHPEFLLDLSRVHFEGWESDRPADEISGQAFTFKALFDITNSNIINDCYLKNTEASYN